MQQVTMIHLNEPGAGIHLGHLSEIELPAPFSIADHPQLGFDLHCCRRGILFLADGRIVRAGDLIVRIPGDSAGMWSEGAVSLWHGHFAVSGGRQSELRTGLEEWAHTLYYAADTARHYENTLLLPDHLTLVRQAEINEVFSLIVQDSHRQRPGWRLAANARFLLLLRMIAEESIESLLRLGNPSANRYITRSIKYIEEHLANKISPSVVAEEMNLNADYLGRLFKRYLGESIGAFIQHRRLAEAKRLLSSSPLCIKQVAAAVGFHDPLYFSRLFKQREGISPSQYQQEEGDLLRKLREGF
jgi:AraC-like DNA-binding protein